MDRIVTRLVDAFCEVLDAEDLNAEGIATAPGHIDVAQMASMFADMFGVSCPASMQVGLGLPDELTIRWQHDEDVSGEAQIRSLLTAMHATLDPSLEDTVIDGHRLGDLRIVDTVVEKAGPLHVLFEVGSDGISERLFLFDARELRPLELAYDAYLEMTAVTRGAVYWQMLFRDLGLNAVQAQILDAELAFLESRFPAAELRGLRDRWRARSR